GPRLESHAANRAGAGPIAHNLGMHGAGVDGAGRGRGSGRGWGSGRERGRGRGGARVRIGTGCRATEIAGGVGGERVPAARAAEVVGPPRVFPGGWGGSRVHLHAADGVGLRSQRRLSSLAAAPTGAASRGRSSVVSRRAGL